MENWNGIPCQDTSDDDGFTESTITTLAERQQKAFEECARLEQGLSKGLEEVEVQPLVGVDVVSDSRKQYLGMLNINAMK